MARNFIQEKQKSVSELRLKDIIFEYRNFIFTFKDMG